MTIFITICIIIAILQFLNWLSFSYLKNRTVKSRKWDLNVCCGKTDGGGINADIFKHQDLPNFVFVKDIYHLPFKDQQFKTVLCSHTIEHVDNPQRFFQELKRVGKEVTLITPPLWDLWAALNFTVHKWLVVSFKKTHYQLPLMVKYSLGVWFDKLFGQVINA